MWHGLSTDPLLRRRLQHRPSVVCTFISFHPASSRAGRWDPTEPCSAVCEPRRGSGRGSPKGPCRQDGRLHPSVSSLHSITESQNHRIVGVGRDLCGSSSPILLLKQGHPEQAAEDLVQVGLEYLQRRRLHNLPGQPGPVLHHPQREEVLPRVQTELPVPQFVPIAPCPVTGHH